MIDALYKIYKMFCKKETILDRLKINSIFRKFIVLVANYILPLYLKLNTHSPNRAIKPQKDNPHIIASLTSFPTRINRLWIVIESILRQTRKPDRLILWLSKEQFASIDNLPKNLIRLQDRGLEIILCDGDLRSHKKYFYVIKDFPQSNLFTFDDDILYPSNTIQSVLEAAKKFPHCVVGRYCNHIKKDKNGDVTFDRNFTEEFVCIPRLDTFIGSGGGAYYPVGSLPLLTQDDSFFMTECKTADDVWLNTMCRYAGYKLVATQSTCPIIEIKSKNNTTLFDVNYGQENHRQLKSARNYCIAHGIDPYKDL